jgi:hypothetical protein
MPQRGFAAEQRELELPRGGTPEVLFELREQPR